MEVRFKNENFIIWLMSLTKNKKEVCALIKENHNYKFDIVNWKNVEQKEKCLKGKVHWKNFW